MVLHESAKTCTERLDANTTKPKRLSLYLLSTISVLVVSTQLETLPDDTAVLSMCHISSRVYLCTVASFLHLIFCNLVKTINY